VAAIKSSDQLEAVRGQFVVRRVRITTQRTESVRWAAASIEPKPGIEREGATVIIGRFHHAWIVIDSGTGGAGCWLPKRVVRDLRLTACTAGD
jgi:hypothetical protein